MTNIAMENQHVYWENSLQIAIFNGYVKLPEGIWVMDIENRGMFLTIGSSPCVRDADTKMKGKRKGGREIICEDALKWLGPWS